MNSRARDARLLVAARFFRSIAQGVLASDFALYLRACGWSGARIGSVLAAGLVVAVALTAFAVLSDRLGRKPFLLGYQWLYVLSCVAAMLDRSTLVLAAAAVAVGFGRGANGAAGPFGALEKAWLTQGLQPPELTRVLGWNSSLGFCGMALGALLGAWPGLGHPMGHIPAAAFAPIFPLALVFSLACLGCLALARDRHQQECEPAEPARERADAQRENRHLRNLGLVNLLQGTGLGLSSPLVSYWFAVRFGLGPQQIAPLMAGSLLAGAIGAQLSIRMTRRWGLMRTLVPLRAAALLALALMPLVPGAAFAMTCFLLHKMLNRSTNPLRASVTARLVRNRRRGLAGAVTSMARTIPRSAGPLIAGSLMDSGALAAPFLLGAAFQAAYLYLYQARFRDSV